MRQSKRDMQKCRKLAADNPSNLWLAFIPTFILSWVDAHGGRIITACAILLGLVVMVLFAKGTQRHHHSWRLSLFITPMALQVSTLVSFYVLLPQWHITWGLLAIAISAGWLWRIEAFLSKDKPLSIEEWIFSAKLFGVGSLLYLILYQLWLSKYSWANSLPVALILLGVIVHQIRINRSAINMRNSFSCPIGTPLVRMAIIRGNQLWLTSRPYTGCFMEEKETSCHTATYKDHPLTSCVNPEETPEEALRRAYHSTGLKLSEEPRFLLKYNYVSCAQHERTVYLFVLNLRSQDALPLRGQFYTPKKIEQRIKEGYFTPLFIEEYSYLKNTLLRANTLNK